MLIRVGTNYILTAQQRGRGERERGPGIGVAPLLVVVALVGGCAETQLITHAAKRVEQARAPEPVSPVYKIGNPYQIDGVWYYPAEDYAYDETGIASWYGPDFDGRPTANGEVYDMNGLSAAHRTLPMPSFVRVTNL